MSSLTFEREIAGRTFTFEATVTAGHPGSYWDPPEPDEVNVSDVWEGDTHLDLDAFFEVLLPDLVGEGAPLNAALSAIDEAASQADRDRADAAIEDDAHRDVGP